jgi:hypothetical protein
MPDIMFSLLRTVKLPRLLSRYIGEKISITLKTLPIGLAGVDEFNAVYIRVRNGAGFWGTMQASENGRLANTVWIGPACGRNRKMAQPLAGSAIP